MIAVTPTTATLIRVTNDREDLEFTVSIADHEVNQIALLMANPIVSKITRVRLTRKLLGCGLREALKFVEACQEHHATTYRLVEERWDHGQQKLKGCYTTDDEDVPF